MQATNFALPEMTFCPFDAISENEAQTEWLCAILDLLSLEERLCFHELACKIKSIYSKEPACNGPSEKI